ncbi:NepR family anti-sigma factor [Aestuariicoccus sp. MJ-SS9]|uniref:NepR family anti-sigma factor n=1 Tax=Aestuariicoccus sp. MJ-SS9 TaxID=3079855 RepID=UPI002911DCB6|nr:NepR family anti-sigma factor [Aestuariicoccus sp. MJ-SS9]MDU8911972.1 NepR family anti-sigma factor [Aestuariicoccus sp. MJ-SS9]
MGHDDKKAKSSQVIDQSLKQVYDQMLEEKVPDRFLDLLAQLKEQENSGSRESGQ